MPTPLAWRLGAAAAAVALILFLAFVRPRHRAHARYLQGFWNGEPSFLRAAGLGGFHVYLDDDAPGSGFLVMLDEAGEALATTGFVLAPRRGPAALRGWSSAVRGHFAGEPLARPMRLSFDDAADGEGPLPGRLDAVADPAAGTLALTADGELYALLVKDFEAGLHA